MKDFQILRKKVLDEREEKSNRRMIDEWLKENSPKVKDPDDWDKPKNGQTSLRGSFGNKGGVLAE